MRKRHGSCGEKKRRGVSGDSTPITNTGIQRGIARGTEAVAVSEIPMAGITGTGDETDRENGGIAAREMEIPEGGGVEAVKMMVTDARGDTGRRVTGLGAAAGIAPG